MSWNFPDYPEDWDSKRQATYSRAGGRCEQCGASGIRLHAHHVVPLSKGGSNYSDNLVCLCEDCHRSQHPHMKESGYRTSPWKYNYGATLTGAGNNSVESNAGELIPLLCLFLVFVAILLFGMATLPDQNPYTFVSGGILMIILSLALYQFRTKK
ncbi:MAG: HNH endonuclease [Methanobacteriota archaeon]